MIQQHKKLLFIGGRFDNSGGRSSKIMRSIAKSICMDKRLDDLPGWYDTWITTPRDDAWTTTHNGGSLDALEQAIIDTADHDIVFWFPDVTNDIEKLAPRIKARNPACTLVTSKRNEGRYTIDDIIAHGLRNHANLMLEIKTGTTPYRARVLDPLGNLYYEGSDFEKAGTVLRRRTDDLMFRTTRSQSECVGDEIPPPDDKEFYRVVRSSADKFHGIIDGIAYKERMIGNASFRCAHGFPSMRESGTGSIYVSRRNIDKRDIGVEGFVACEPGIPVKYYGDAKPSVDTPIQLSLYEALPKINYMLHGHVYVQDAPYTTKVLPCGAIEEAREILAVVPSDTTRFAINLAGHGCIIGSDSAAALEGYRFVPRPMPENQTRLYE